MKTLIVLSLLALYVLGATAVDAEPTCTDLAGLGTVCHEETVDTSNGVDVYVSASVVVNGP